MSRATFRDRVSALSGGGLRVCAGFDPITAKMPSHLRAKHGGDVPGLWREFMGALVEVAAGRVGAYKPNWAFFLTLGSAGLDALAELCSHIRARDPEALLVLDMKVGDIADTNLGYVHFAFEVLGADAVTLHPYLGREALAPFLRDATRGAFVLCRTSNPGGSELQGLTVREGEGGELPLYRHVARRVSEWNALGNCGLVLGATYPDELRAVREDCPGLPLLIPGVGKQGGDPARVREALAAGGDGAAGYFVNQSSGFMYASSEADYAEAAGRVLDAMRVALG